MLYEKTLPVYLSTTLSEQAERDIISSFIESDFFCDPAIQRKLSSYPIAADESEKDILIIELMEHFWNFSSSKTTFSAFRDFESVFTILEQRGHFIHQFEVFLLGWHLIDIFMKTDRMSRLSKIFGSKEKTFYSWLFASTAHDFGYPLQVAGEIAKKFSDLYKKIHMINISKKYKSLVNLNHINAEDDLSSVEAFNIKKNRTEKVDIKRFIKEGIALSIKVKKNELQEILIFLEESNNHGYVSAMILCRSYIDYLSKEEKWGLSSEKWRITNLKRVVGAVALHAIPASKQKYIKKISFDLNPLAYLLYLIDNIQDWNRSLRNNEKWPSYTLKEFVSEHNSITLSYVLYHEKWDYQIKERVRNGLQTKEDLIKVLQKPSLDFEIVLNFISNENDFFKEIVISL